MDFQISILNTLNEESVLVTEDSIVVNDRTDYVGTDESGHTKLDFTDFRKIILTSNTGYSYTLSSLGDGDAAIDPPDEAVSNPDDDVFIPYVEDGIYTLALMAVPTWNGTDTYVQDHCVYHGGVLYQALQGTTNDEPGVEGSEGFWEEIDEDDLPSKYRHEYSFPAIYDLQIRHADFIKEACSDNIGNVGVNFLENSSWEKSARLDNIISAISVYAAEEEWNTCDHLIAASKLIT